MKSRQIFKYLFVCFLLFISFSSCRTHNQFSEYPFTIYSTNPFYEFDAQRQIVLYDNNAFVKYYDGAFFGSQKRVKDTLYLTPKTTYEACDTMLQEKFLIYPDSLVSLRPYTDNGIRWVYLRAKLKNPKKTMKK